MPKLNQILAIEKNVKNRVHSEITQIRQMLEKPTVFNGFSKTYTKKDEDGDNFPPENNRVQMVASELLKDVEKHLTELLDVTVTKDLGNCTAKANVVVDGKIIIQDVPATFLLFLEKQLIELQSFINQIPVLEAEEEWSFDEKSNLYKTPPILTSKTKKLQKPIVLYGATEKHPAQTQLITEDVIIGTWATIKQSGALLTLHKKALLEKIQKLAKAVKFAREEANGTQVENKEVGKAIFQYLFEK
jgi:hypothetical protein